MKKKVYYSLLFIIITFIILFISSIRVNISPSAPEGIYIVNYFSKIFKPGDFIIYKMPKDYQIYISDTFKKLDTIKEIKAVVGDTVYIKNNIIFINNEPSGKIKYNIPLVLNENKYVLNDNEFLTLSDNEDSIDGRYYGLINRKKIKYKAYLLYEYKRIVE